MLTSIAIAAAGAIHYSDLHISPVALDLGFVQLRWYSLSYITGILLGWWYLLRLLSQPGAPMAKRHADDLVFYATLGVIVGGRLGYVFFYKPSMLLTPIDIVKLWEGGMSYHGGMIGVALGMGWMAWKQKLNFIRIADYVCCVVPIGLFLGRLANFVNGELWGRPTTLPWGIVFPATQDGIPRHPSQLYEAGLEGIVLFTVLALMFWKSDARYQPGKLAGTFLALYGVFRTGVEMLRQPDHGLENLSWGLTMGQTLSIPMILLGLFLIFTAKSRRTRVEPIAGTASVA